MGAESHQCVMCDVLSVVTTDCHERCSATERAQPGLLQCAQSQSNTLSDQVLTPPLCLRKGNRIKYLFPNKNDVSNYVCQILSLCFSYVCHVNMKTSEWPL